MKQGKRRTDKEIVKDRERYAEKEAAQHLESMKLQAQIATELTPLISIDQEKVKAILEKYREKIDSIFKEKSGHPHDQAGEFEIQ